MKPAVASHINQKTSLRWVVLTLIAVGAFAGLSYALYSATQSYVISKAEMDIQTMLLQHRGVHHYVQQLSHNELYNLKSNNDIPETLYSPVLFSSSFMVRNMHNFYNEERDKAGLPELYYKMAADNPRNPINKADDYELAILRRFNDDRSLKQVREIIDIDGQKYLYTAIPFLETKESCLKCHGKREDAPVQLQERYPGYGGFGDKIGNIRAIESLRAPLGSQLAVANIVLIAGLMVGLGFAGMLWFNRYLKTQVSARTSELKKASSQLQSIFDASMDIAFIITDTSRKNPRILEFSPGAECLFGYAREDVVGNSVSILHSPKDIEQFPAWIDFLLKSRHGERREIQMLRKSGESFPALLTTYPLINNDGSITQLLGIAIDISDQKRAEEELLEKTGFINRVLEQSPFATWIADTEGTLVKANPALKSILNLTDEQLVGHYNLFQDPLLEKQGLIPQIRTVFEEGKTIHFACQWCGEDIPTMDLKGSTFVDIEATIFPIHNAEGKLTNAIVTWYDVSERKQAQREKENLEAQLRQSQKMEAIGQLAGGVAHDFNNILTAILGYTELTMADIQRELGPNHSLLSSMEEIEESAQRASALTRQLLTFSRKQVSQVSSLNLNTTIQDLDKMLRRLLTENIKLEKKLNPGLNKITADISQIEQVILNIVINAGDAMPNGGRLTIETTNIDLDEQYTKLHAEASIGPHVLMSISDTGIGMDRETCDRIFEPFYTTKKPGRGTGLGLATAYGIVKQAGGHFQVYSESGHGTTFKIYLPAQKEAPVSATPAKTTFTDLSGTETILLCEDDHAVRELTAHALQAAGYVVLDASSGLNAVHIANANSSPIHLLITDVIMPDMNGKELAIELQKNHPDLPTLFISGYTANVIAHHGVLDEGVEFLEKPFTRTRLLTRVREVLIKANDRLKTN